MKTIRVYRTHTEICPYKEGECKGLEYMLAVWISQRFTLDRIAFTIRGDTLYIPRGIDPNYLSRVFPDSSLIMETNHDPYEYMDYEHTPKCPPKDQLQRDSIDFLCGRGEFKRSASYSQVALNAGTGDGKTFCTLSYITHSRMRSLIITHDVKIRKQWYNSCIEMFGYDEDELRIITGSEAMAKILNANEPPKGSIFFMSHQTLMSFAKIYGPEKMHEFFIKLRIGIKVYDEAHLEFKAIVKIDMFSNTFRTVYLTASFDRSDPNESKIFQRSFANVIKFKPEIDDYDTKRRHIIYCPVLYTSNCPEYQQMSFKNGYGFNSKRFIDYALRDDEENTMMKILKKVLENIDGQEGRVIVLNPKIEWCEYLKSVIEDLYPDKIVRTIHGKNRTDDNLWAKENADVICTTMRSSGTGLDVKKLRFLINLEPYASKVTTDQMSGRLREYSPDMDTYMFDLVDVSITRVFEMYKLRLRALKKKCKQIHVIDINKK